MRGGPLRGHVYVFKNRGTAFRPELEKGEPLMAGERPVEAQGQVAPTFGDFRGTGQLDLICGDFLDRLHFFPALGGGRFGEGRILRDASGAELVLDHCIHFPTAVDWGGTGRADLLVAAEDGYVWCLRNRAVLAEGVPTFDVPIRLGTAMPDLHAGIAAVPAAADWTGTGRTDLVVGNSAGELLFYANHGPSDAPRFGKERRLRAGGEAVRIRAGPTGSIQGPSERKFGYTCPPAATPSTVTANRFSILSI